jgi:L-fuculose-phosphate aldolase
LERSRHHALAGSSILVSGEWQSLTTYAGRQQETALREEVVRVCRLIWERGFVAATDGNVSARLGKDRLLTTPSGFSKGFLSPSDVVMCNMEGKAVRLFSQRGKQCEPSSEILLHLEVYSQRPDVQAVVHAHPPLAIAFTIAGVSLAQCVLPEVVVNLGQVPTTAYATPATAEGPVVVRELIRDHDALIIDRHGTVTVGPTLFEAYMKLEKVEHLAQVTLAARQLGRVGLLPPKEVRKLVEMRRQKLGLPPDYDGPGCVLCGACGRDANAGNVSDEELVRQVAETVSRELSKQLS